MLLTLGLSYILMASAQPAQVSPTGRPFLSPIFGSHMVLQRDRANAFWGWTEPGETVTVKFGDKTATTKADKNGKWKASVMPPHYGGPYTVSIKGSQSAELTDILVGDVWVCSGQSNMEMGIKAVKNGPTETAQANNPNIRLFLADKSASSSPQIINKGEWKVCTSENIAQGGWDFSAVGYFFGRELQKTLEVPIGLIQTAWGGTTAEAWTSESGLAKLPDFKTAITQSKDRAKSGAQTTQEAIDTWCITNDPGSNLKTPYYIPETSTEGWTTHEGPPVLSEIGLAGAQSVVWYKHEFELTEEMAEGHAQITTGSYDGYSDYWINGKYIGGQPSVLVWGQHNVAEEVLKPGKNVITVRGIGQMWGGGFNNGKDVTVLHCENGTQVSMRGIWHAKETTKLSAKPALPPIIDGNPFWVSSLNNSMIHPFAGMAIKGAIWYQGESNVGRAEQYSRLLPAMIEDWRSAWGQSFPFYIVQLANYGTRNPEPANEGWPQLQAAQQLAAEKTKDSGFVVTNDIGEGNDIHPKNKQEVGHRLALLALKKTYGKDLIASGPQFKKLARVADLLVLTFDSAEGMMIKKAIHSSFAIAGADGKYHWATAAVKGSTIVLTAPEVLAPVSVRYAWDSDAIATLFNGASLPSAPFEAHLKK